jgi:hypothetical protein
LFVLILMSGKKTIVYRAIKPATYISKPASNLETMQKQLLLLAAVEKDGIIHSSLNVGISYDEMRKLTIMYGLLLTCYAMLLT